AASFGRFQERRRLPAHPGHELPARIVHPREPERHPGLAVLGGLAGLDDFLHYRVGAKAMLAVAERGREADGGADGARIHGPQEEQPRAQLGVPGADLVERRAGQPDLEAQPSLLRSLRRRRIPGSASAHSRIVGGCPGSAKKRGGPIRSPRLRICHPSQGCCGSPTQNRSTVSIRAPRSTGFLRNPCAAICEASKLASACALRTITGMARSDGSCCCAARKALPSITGIIMSRRIRHGWRFVFRSSASATAPFSAL